MVRINNGVKANLSVKPQATVKPEPTVPGRTIVKSVHIYLDENGDIDKIENRKDKDKTVYIYNHEGKCFMELAEGSKFDLSGLE